MRRSRLQTILHDYVAGDLDETARRDIERRIRKEPQVRALLDEVRAAHDALLTLRERPEPPVSAEDAVAGIQARLVSTRFEARPKLHLESQGTRFYRRLALAASLLFALTAGFFAYSSLQPEDPEVTTAPPVAADARPTAAERGLEPFVAAGRRGGMTAEEYVRKLRELGIRPADLSITPPDDDVMPIAGTTPEER
jgi:anti-sigma-K factor RskA